MTDETLIIDQSISPRFFAMIPYLIDDMGLSVYAVRLYLRILRRAGNDGFCWENTRNLAAGCNMSIGKVSQAKRELEQNGLITITLKDTKHHGEFPYHEITINPIWKQNIEKYSTCSPHEQDQFTQRDRTVSPHEPKENPLKEKASELKGPRQAQHSTPGKFPKTGNFPGGTNYDATKSDKNILLIKEITGYYPRTKALRKRIIAKCFEDLGDGGLLDKERLTRVYTNWCASGYNPGNYNGWFFERYFEDEGFVPDYDTRAMPKTEK